MDIVKPLPVKQAIPRHTVNYNSWPIEWLANYVEKLQRKTITEKSRAVRQNMKLVQNNRNGLNKYFLQLEVLFTESVDRLSAHMKKEEQHLFPVVREMVQAKELNRGISRTAFDKIGWLIDLLNEEHANERLRWKTSREVRNNCGAFPDLSKPQNNLLAEMDEFEQACELHIDLQCRFMFPKLIAIKYGAG